MHHDISLFGLFLDAVIIAAGILAYRGWRKGDGERARKRRQRERDKIEAKK